MSEGSGYVSDGKSSSKKNPDRRRAKRMLNRKLDQLQAIEDREAKLEGRTPVDVISEYKRRKAREANTIDVEIVSETEENRDLLETESIQKAFGPPKALIAKNAEPQQHSIGNNESNTATNGHVSQQDSKHSGSDPTTKHHETQQDSNREGSKPTKARPGGQSNDVVPQRNLTKDVPRFSDEWWNRQPFTTQQKRCRADKVHGGRCGMYASPGARVCKKHGASAPAVKAAARTRLEMAADLLVQRLLNFSEDTDIKPETRLRATDSALDRIGLRAPSEVILSPGSSTPFDDVYADLGGFSGIQHAEPGYVEAEQTEAIGDQADFNPFDTDDVLNDVDYQQDSNAQNDAAGFDADGHRPADRQHAERAGSEERSRHDGPYDPPAARRTAERHQGASQYRSEHVTGDDAIAAANQANRAAGVLKALPPGRRRRG